MGKLYRNVLVGALGVLLLGVAPYVYFRSVYAHGKRLREVEPGRFYRSGQMTAEGFAEAVARFHLRTIINVQDDNPDPDLPKSYWDSTPIKESELCRQLGVRYVQLSPDLLPRSFAPVCRPRSPRL
jgi:hypothetical protein